MTAPLRWSCRLLFAALLGFLIGAGAWAWAPMVLFEWRAILLLLVAACVIYALGYFSREVPPRPVDEGYPLAPPMRERRIYVSAAPAPDPGR